VGQQFEMPFFSEINRPVLVDESVIEKNCKSELDAIRLCVNLSTYKYAQNKLAEALGLDRGRMSCILNGTKHLPANLRIRFMELCGNLAPMQYEAIKLRVDIRQMTLEEENNKLRKKLAEAEIMANEYKRIVHNARAA